MISHRVQKRLTHEVHEALALRDKRGQSKHKDKQAARKAAQDNHTAYKTITGLYATTSLTTYARQAKTALCWIAERYGCRNLAECKEHLPAYYADMIARNLSAWTIRTRVYAGVRRVRSALSRTVRGRKPADTPPRRYNAGANTKRKQ